MTGSAENVAYTVTAEILVQADSAALAERIVRDAICDVADDWRLIVECGNLLDQEDSLGVATYRDADGTWRQEGT